MANKVYVNPETVKVFKNSGGDVTFTLTSVADAAGRISARLDLGAGPRARRYTVAIKTKWAATPTLKYAGRLYVVAWLGEGATPDIGSGDFGSTDAAASDENQLVNLQQIETVVVDEAGTNPHQRVMEGSFEYVHRHISLLFWNAGGAALSSTAGDHEIRLIPVPDEVQ